MSKTSASVFHAAGGGSKFHADSAATGVNFPRRLTLKLVIDEASAVVTFDPLPTVQGDASHITRLFQNIVGNAIKYHAVDRPPTIHISAVKTEALVTFSVRDNGIGIEPEYFERIFNIFQRLHGRDEYSGTGIGLAVCKRIVERHGGHIWLESAPGQGSCFFFTLPAER